MEEAEAEAAGPSAASLCYSEFEKKPQNRFKQVLADDSYNAFQHLKREGKAGGILIPSVPPFEGIGPIRDVISLLLLEWNHKNRKNKF